MKYKAKYIETSPGINHNIDELLVGIVKQIRGKKKKKQGKVMKLLGKVLNVSTDRSKSCSNLSIV